MEDPVSKEWLAYHELEFVLRCTFRAPDGEAQSKLRSRYKNFQKLGLPLNRRPGKGSKSRFTIIEVCEIILAFQLAEYDMSPSVIAELIAIFARTSVSMERKKRKIETGVLTEIARELKLVGYGDITLYGDLFLVFKSTFLSARWFSPIIKDLEYKLLHAEAFQNYASNMSGANCVVNISSLARETLKSARLLAGHQTGDFP